MNGKQVAMIVFLVIFFFGIPAVIITSIVNYASLHPEAKGVTDLSPTVLKEAVFNNSDLYYILAIICLVTFILIIYLFIKSRTPTSDGTKTQPKKSNEKKKKSK